MSDNVSSADVKRLRDETGAGFMDCRRALQEAGGDFEAAKDLLRTWGLAGIAKRASRAASEGAVVSYLHQLDPELPPKVGVLVEINCETDFVAKTQEFKDLGRALAMQIAAMEPRWITREEVPAELLEREKEILLASDQVAGKPSQVVEKIVEGKLGAIFSDKGGVLLEQLYVRDDAGKKKVKELIDEIASSVKENIVVRRFARFRVGEE